MEESTLKEYFDRFIILCTVIFILVMTTKGITATFMADNIKNNENSLSLYSNKEINNETCTNYYKLEYYQNGTLKTVECSK